MGRPSHAALVFDNGRRPTPAPPRFAGRGEDLPPEELSFYAQEEDEEAFPIIADAQSRRIAGRLSEAHALREYGRELEKRNREFVTR